MSYFRSLGALLKSKVNSTKDFADATGYSLTDAGRIFDGRLFLSPNQMKAVADAIGITLEEMLNHEVREPIECMGEFSNEENKEMLLDYIDRYIDLKESVK